MFQPSIAPLSLTPPPTLDSFYSHLAPSLDLRMLEILVEHGIPVSLQGLPDSA